jgi:7-cyano-7-deazaguanine reductase
VILPELSPRLADWRPGDARWSIPTRDLAHFRVPAEATLERVVLESDEVTTLDKLSNRPDFLTVRIEYQPRDWLLGSRGLRVYFQSLRDERTSVEGLAATIADDIERAIAPKSLTVTVTEKPRGGVAITATAVPRASQAAHVPR